MTTASLVLPTRTLAAALVDERSLPSHLQCSSCAQPVVNSFQTPHGCRLCQNCFDGLPAQDKVACPGKTEACKDQDEEIFISQASCFPDIASRREIGKLKVFCPNKGDGCRAQFPWRQAEAHLADCEFEKLQCDLCGEKKLKREMDDHKNSQCRQRHVTCDRCRVQVVAYVMETEHLSLQSIACCQEFTAPCPHCHEGDFNRQAFLKHLPECRLKPTQCKFAHLGCDFVAPAGEMPAHFSDSADRHLQLIDQRLKVNAQLSAFSVPAGAAAAASVGASAMSATPVSMETLTKDVKEQERRAMNIFLKFKSLQPNVASWALTTMELEELMKAFGGYNAFKTMLKNMDDKLRQLEAAERSSASTGASNVAAAQSTTTVDTARVLEQMRSIELRFEILEQTSFDGCLTWKVTGVATRRREARSGSPASLFSPPFVSRRYGYMFRVRLFLNGNEGAEGSHASVQLVLIQGEYDDVQEWPLVADVTFRLMHSRNRSEDLVAKAILNVQRPPGPNDLTVNTSLPKFVKIDQLEEKFVRNDCLYLETEVEPRPSEASRRGRRR